MWGLWARGWEVPAARSKGIRRRGWGRDGGREKAVPGGGRVAAAVKARRESVGSLNDGWSGVVGVSVMGAWAVAVRVTGAIAAGERVALAVETGSAQRRREVIRVSRACRGKLLSTGLSALVVGGRGGGGGGRESGREDDA
jgi:hypothetical protein